jgi:probable HAF family extracellular repeat protein
MRIALAPAVALTRALIVAFVLLTAGSASGSPRYTVTSLGWNGVGYHEGAISNGGQVGFFSQHGPATLDLYGPDAGTLRAPGMLGWTRGSFGDLNDRGQMVGTGYAGKATDPPEIFNMSARAVMTDANGSRNLGVLPGHDASAATGINERGMVVGSSIADARYGPTTARAFAWTEASGMIDLGVAAPGHRSSEAAAVNERGQVVGTSWDAQGTPHAFLHEDGRMRALDALGAGMSRANDINDAGRVVGTFTPASSPSEGHAYVLDSASGRVQDLGTLGGGMGWAQAINNRDQVVGWSSSGLDGPGKARGYLFDDGRMYDLNDLVESDIAHFVERALDINDAGQILAVGRTRGYTDLLLLTPTDSLLPEPSGVRRIEVGPGVRAYPPVPEPTALAAFAALAGLLVLRRRRG